MIDFTDDFDMEEYPFRGAFYEQSVDTSLPLNEQTSVDTLILETKCDIQRTSKLNNAGLLAASYTVYWPLEVNPFSVDSTDRFMPIQIRRGMIFKGTMYGYSVEGTVEIVRPSQLGGCSCDVKVNTETASSDTGTTDTDNSTDTDTDNTGGEDNSGGSSNSGWSLG
jgi:hypothetical protein